MIAVLRNGLNREKTNLNKKIVQLTHSELDIKHKNSHNKNKNVKMKENFQRISGELKKRTAL